MPARKVEDAIAPYRADLGKVADSAIATKAGVSRSVVVNYRKKLGIPAYEGYKFGAREDKVASPVAPKGAKTSAPADVTPRRKPGRPPKPKATAAAAVATDSKVFRGRKSKLDAFADMLGKVPDSEIARMADVTQENVRTYRMRRGIEAPRAPGAEAVTKPAPAVAEVTETAPKAAPAPKASTPSAGLVFSVQIETEKGVRTYAVVAKDIAEAAKTALGRAAAKHGKATIKSLQYVAELL